MNSISTLNKAAINSPLKQGFYKAASQSSAQSFKISPFQPSTSLLRPIVSLLNQFFNHSNNLIMGTSKSNFLQGTQKADTILAKDGNDLIFAGKGNDRIFAGKGNDLIFDGRGNDYIAGGRGNDKFIVGKGDNQIFGGNGKDVAIFKENKAHYSIRNFNNTTTVTHKQTGDVNTLHGVEKIKFHNTGYISINPRPPIVVPTPPQSSTSLVGDTRPAVNLPKDSAWISQISGLFGGVTGLPELADAGISTMVSQASASDLKDAVIKQLSRGDYDLAHNLFQALGSPLYPRNRSLLARPHLNDFINYVKSVDANTLQAALVNNLPSDSAIIPPVVVPVASSLVGSTRTPVDLPKDSAWISQISGLFGGVTGLPQLMDTGVLTMVSQANTNDLKEAVIKQLGTGDYELAHNLFQALGNPLYPRNSSLLAQPHLNDFINYVNTVDATVLKEAIVNNLPADTNDFFLSPTAPLV